MERLVSTGRQGAEAGIWGRSQGLGAHRDAAFGQLTLAITRGWGGARII